MLAGVALPAQAADPGDVPPAAAEPMAPAEPAPVIAPAGQVAERQAAEAQAVQTAPQPMEAAEPDAAAPPVVEAPQAPGKDDGAEQADPGGGGKGKSGTQVPSGQPKGKSGSAPPAEPVNPATPPTNPPATAPSTATPTPATEPQPNDDTTTESPQSSNSVDEPVGQPGGLTGAGAGAGATAEAAPAAIAAPTLAAADAPAPSSAAGDDRAQDGTGGASAPDSANDDSGVTRTVREVVEVVPEPLKAALALLAALAILFGGGYLLAAMRARRLGRQRRELMQEVGLLQAALLPPVPEKVGAVRASVAYRPSDGPGAGGDFYDALTLPGGRAAFILGDVSGHGRAALAHTAFMRYTLRAYLEAGLEPRLALQVAERAVGGQLDGDFATVIVAVHDPSNGSLTYASAGHPAPIVAGGARHEPVLAAWSPPIGWGLPTGLRQTTVPLPSGAIACLYTDGLAEATTEDGILGRARLAEIVGDAGREATAQDVLDAVKAEAVSVRDDMAACLIAPAREVSAGAFRTELLELGPSELHEGLAVRFLEECHVPASAIDVARDEARSVVEEHGGALMVVKFGVRGSRVEVLPRNVESLQAAALKRSAAR